MILLLPIRRTSLPTSSSLSNFTWGNWNPLQHNSHHVLHRFQYFVLSHSTTSHHKYWIYQIIYEGKPIKLIIKLHIDHDTWWVKHANHQKAASPSNLENMVNNSSNFNTKYAEFLQNDKCYFVFTIHLVDRTNTASFTKKQFLFFSQFSLPYFTLTCSKNHPYNPH